MGIMEKVEEIRSKPENIRIRYVWFFVAISMLFVIILWIFSLAASRQESQSVPSDNNIFNSDILDQFDEQKEALDKTRQNIQGTLSDLENAASSAPQSAENNNQSEADLNNGSGQ